VLIEGLPPFPPVSALHKCLTLLPFLAVLAVAGFGRDCAWARGLQVIGILLAALLWIAWTRITDLNLLTRIAAILPLVLTLALGTSLASRASAFGFAYPSAVLMTSIGAAILALLGAHIGGAQSLGAIAALTGGLLLPGFVAHLSGRTATLPSPSTVGVIATIVGIFALQSVLFAPNAPALPLLLLALCPAIPAFLPAKGPGSRPFAPILAGLVAALPAAVAVILALLLR
jgi:hypothetical protein